MFGEKRGQLTLFVIVAVIIVIVVIGYFLISSLNREDSFDSAVLNEKYALKKEGISDCYSFLAKNMIDLVGIQGGYYDFPAGAEYEGLGVIGVAYYVKNGDDVLPVIRVFEKGIADAIDDNFVDECLDEVDFEDFEVSSSDPKTNVKIDGGSIVLKTNILITFKNGESSVIFDFGKRESVFDTKINEMYEIISFMVKSEVESGGFLEMSEVAELATSEEVYVSRFAFYDDNKTSISMIYINEEKVYPSVVNFLTAGE